MIDYGLIWFVVETYFNVVDKEMHDGFRYRVLDIFPDYQKVGLDQPFWKHTIIIL